MSPPYRDRRRQGGDPTPEELAALVAVVAARRAAPADGAESPSNWAAYWRSVRQPLPHGPSVAAEQPAPLRAGTRRASLRAGLGSGP